MVIILIPPPHQIDFVSLRTRSPFRYFLTMLPFSLTILNVLSKVWLLFCTYPSSHKNVILEFFFVAKEIFWYVLYLSPHIVVIFIYSSWNLLNGLSTIWLLDTTKTLHSKLYEQHCTSILKDLMGRTVHSSPRWPQEKSRCARVRDPNCCCAQQCSKRSAASYRAMIWARTSELMCYWRRCGAISEIRVFGLCTVS